MGHVTDRLLYHVFVLRSSLKGLSGCFSVRMPRQTRQLRALNHIIRSSSMQRYLLCSQTCLHFGCTVEGTRCCLVYHPRCFTAKEHCLSDFSLSIKRMIITPAHWFLPFVRLISYLLETPRLLLFIIDFIIDDAGFVPYDTMYHAIVPPSDAVPRRFFSQAGMRLPTRERRYSSVIGIRLKCRISRKRKTSACVHSL